VQDVGHFRLSKKLFVVEKAWCCDAVSFMLALQFTHLQCSQTMWDVCDWSGRNLE